MKLQLLLVIPTGHLNPVKKEAASITDASMVSMSPALTSAPLFAFMILCLTKYVHWSISLSLSAIFCYADILPLRLRNMKTTTEDDDEQRYYLCLQVATPKNKRVSDDCPFESYAKQQKKPVYWFSIPSSK